MNCFGAEEKISFIFIKFFKEEGLDCSTLYSENGFFSSSKNVEMH